MELFHSSCATVTKGTCSISPFIAKCTLHFTVSFWGIDDPSSLLCCLDCYIFLAHFQSGIIPLLFMWMSHKSYAKVSPFPLSEPSVETVSLSFVCPLSRVLFFLFESSMTHSYSNAVWTATHIFFSLYKCLNPLYCF